MCPYMHPPIAASSATRSDWEGATRWRTSPPSADVLRLRTDLTRAAQRRAASRTLHIYSPSRAGPSVGKKLQNVGKCGPSVNKDHVSPHFPSAATLRRGADSQVWGRASPKGASSRRVLTHKSGEVLTHKSGEVLTHKSDSQVFDAVLTHKSGEGASSRQCPAGFPGGPLFFLVTSKNYEQMTPRAHNSI